jgi:hypothetical protein
METSNINIKGLQFICSKQHSIGVCVQCMLSRVIVYHCGMDIMMLSGAPTRTHTNIHTRTHKHTYEHIHATGMHHDRIWHQIEQNCICQSLTIISHLKTLHIVYSMLFWDGNYTLYTDRLCEKLILLLGHGLESVHKILYPYILPDLNEK